MFSLRENLSGFADRESFNLRWSSAGILACIFTEAGSSARQQSARHPPPDCAPAGTLP
jgi:hypothetical protein